MLSRIKGFLLGRNTMQFTFLFLVILYGLFFESGILQDHYLFYTGSQPRPPFWWPVRSHVVTAGLIAISVVLFLLSRTQWRERLKGWCEGLLVAGIVAMFAAIAVGTATGVAVYPDRAESRLLTFKGYDREVLDYRSVRYVTLGCKVVDTRGNVQAQVFYALHGQHEAIVDLEQGLSKRADDATWLKAVHMADAALPGMTVRRQLEPQPDSAGQYKACVESFRKAQAESDKPLVDEVFSRPDVIGLLN
ncbi:hypothetical protein ABAC460_13985 [Asticcacaulis sp. AC460]|uniref:hypothetical protein n=1 Tax=Asticcacaulis sp. AC460 TaxID=1282360 RepID=UPI0003C3D1A3|nr:hypothetical protein [Asticcacaulis sp. AC460]ESQ88886.1 hypothetical protein ABAC460_13985 [Asticcacaulis sp. AC460]